jgi:hypothetical protein
MPCVVSSCLGYLGEASLLRQHESCFVDSPRLVKVRSDSSTEPHAADRR